MAAGACLPNARNLDLTQLQTQIDETRKGRVEIWSEVNGLRERVGVVETKIDGVQNNAFST